MPRSPLPASTETLCDQLIEKLGGVVVKFGRKGKRTTNTDGVPDRLYLVKGKLWWFEIKSKNDYLSAQQFAFLTNIQTHGGIAGCGNRDDLCTLLNAPHPFNIGFRQTVKYSTRQKALRGT